MTTKVTILMDKPNHQDILVEPINPLTGTAWHGATRMMEGETRDFYVHGHMSLRITEIAKVVAPTDKTAEQPAPASVPAKE